MTKQISRRTTLAAGVWSVPVVLTAVAAPAAAASTPPPPPPPPVCIPGVSYEFLDLDLWNGQNLPQGLQITNNTGRSLDLTGEVTNTPSYAGLGDFGGGSSFVNVGKNGGTFKIVIPNGTTVILRLYVDKESNNSAGFLQLFSVCDGLGKIKMKTVGKIDRIPE